MHDGAPRPTQPRWVVLRQNPYRPWPSVFRIAPTRRSGGPRPTLRIEPHRSGHGRPLHGPKVPAAHSSQQTSKYVKTSSDQAPPFGERPWRFSSSPAERGVGMRVESCRTLRLVSASINSPTLIRRFAPPSAGGRREEQPSSPSPTGRGVGVGVGSCSDVNGIIRLVSRR